MINASIIIVNYKVKKEILACIASIYKSKPKASYEIIVVDNASIDKFKGQGIKESKIK